MIASSEDSTSATRYPAFSSARLRSLTSLNTSTVPWIGPLSPRIGAPLSSIGISVPSCAMRIVWLASPTIAPSRNTFVTGLSTLARVNSLTIRNTSSRCLPTTSTPGARSKDWATLFANTMRPLASVDITASPILAIVVFKESRAFWASVRAPSRATTALLIEIFPTTKKHRTISEPMAVIRNALRAAAAPSR